MNNYSEKSFDNVNFEEKEKSKLQLQTIYSVMNESQEKVTDTRNTIVDNEKTCEIDRQLQDMNQAITELKHNHSKQIEDMKTFYDQQIDELRLTK